MENEKQTAKKRSPKQIALIAALIVSLLGNAFLIVWGFAYYNQFQKVYRVAQDLPNAVTEQVRRMEQEYVQEIKRLEEELERLQEQLGEGGVEFQRYNACPVA